MKLAQKFTLALVMIMLITVSARTYFDTERRIDQHVETIRASQRLLGDVLSASVDTIWRAKGWEAALAFLRQVEKQQGSTEIRWTWLTEQPLSEYTPRVSLTRLRKLSQGEPRIEIDRSEGRGYVISYLRVELPNHPLGAIELTRSTTSEEQYAGEERNQQIATSALVILAFAMIASVLGRGLVGEPISELIEHAKRVGAGDFTNLAVVRSGDEIGTLAQEMNSMSERLRRAREKASKERKLRLEVEAQLTHADRLASVGRLTASVVHDMGTPLNVISGRAMMIMESGDASEEIKNNSQRIADQSERIAGMLRQLLTYARKDAGAKEETSLMSLVNDVVGLVAPLARKSKVEVSVEEGAVDTTLPLNRSRFRQVLMNLAMNGVQAMTVGGKLTISVGLRTWGSSGSNYAFISVRDEGAGIPPELREQIFEPFFTTKSEKQGTGLGLSVCDTIVRQHGGEIEVDSVVGRGTTFTVYLPIEGEVA